MVYENSFVNDPPRFEIDVPGFREYDFFVIYPWNDEGRESFSLKRALTPALSIFFFACSAFSCGRAVPQAMSREEAWAHVKAEMGITAASQVKAYAAKEEMPAAAKIPSWGRSIAVPDKMLKAWFFFVDKAPEANWEHDCAYVFVDAASGRIEILKDKRPPDFLDNMETVFPEKS